MTSNSGKIITARNRDHFKTSGAIYTYSRRIYCLRCYIIYSIILPANDLAAKVLNGAHQLMRLQTWLCCLFSAFAQIAQRLQCGQFVSYRRADELVDRQLVFLRPVFQAVMGGIGDAQDLCAHDVAPSCIKR